MAVDLLEMLARAARSTEAVLARLDEADQTRLSPCPEMNVGQVAAHLTGGIRYFTQVADGGPPTSDPDLDPDRSSEPAAAAFREAVDQLTTAFSGQGRMEVGYEMPWGTTTGAQLVGFELIETVVHGWDIARGLGVPYEVDDAVVTATLNGAREWVDDSVRVPGMFGPEVAVGDASSLERLVAFLGRDPAWKG